MGIWIAIGVILGACLLAEFWDDINDWIKKQVERLKRTAVKGVKVFIKKVKEFYQEILKIYRQEGGEWIERTEIREKKISEDEVPKEIRDKAKNGNETDITEEYEEQLKLAN